MKYGRAGRGVAPEKQQRSILTREGEDALRNELDRLRGRLDVEFVSRLRDARAFGDIAGNDEYLQIKEEEGVLAAGISRLEVLLASSRVADEVDPTSGLAAIGTVVEVEDLDTGAVDDYLMTGGYERLTSHAASAGSPVGRALMGRAAREEVEVELPGDRKRRLRIVAVRHPARE